MLYITNKLYMHIGSKGVGSYIYKALYTKPCAQTNKKALYIKTLMHKAFCTNKTIK